jgi:cell wall-associated NlpC family hydrolase
MLMISGKLALVLFMCAIAGQACIFVVHDKEYKGHLSSTDTLRAYSIDTIKTPALEKDTIASTLSAPNSIKTKNVRPEEVVQFAESLIGTPYKFGSTDPKAGFDCSGFITYVFNHFGITVPRSSIDFTKVGKEVFVDDANLGDLILFTGTDSTERSVGHMGLIVSHSNGIVNFIHSSSGKVNGVTITPLNDYYKGRYMKTIRIFPQNGM